MYIKAILVMAGGGLGCLLRYLISLLQPGYYIFPIPATTFLVNLSGSIVAGILFWFAANGTIHDHWKLFLLTGMLGGFTTFSAFSLEALQFLNAGKIITALSYIALQNITCITGAFAGYAIIRFIMNFN